MLTISDIQLAGLATHYVGNNAAGDVLQLSKKPVTIDSEELRQVLLQYFLTPFKEAASYNLWHPADLNLNEVMSFVSAIFDEPKSLLKQSANLARHLYDITMLPQIKSGELPVAELHHIGRDYCILFYKLSKCGNSLENEISYYNSR